MKKLICGIILLCATNAFAFNEPIALPLENYLKSLGKAEGAKVNTACDNGNYIITGWEVDGVKKPSEEELATIVGNYKNVPKDKTIEDRVLELESKTMLIESAMPMGVLETK